MEMTSEDISRLKHAIDLLENPGLAAKLTNVIGIPFEKAFDYLSAKWSPALMVSCKKYIY